MNPTTLSDSAYLRLTPWCVVRPQEYRYLIYNTRSDELHLIPPTGFLVYSLCDGSHSVREIAKKLADKLRATDRVDLELRVREYLCHLVARGILEVDDA